MSLSGCARRTFGLPTYSALASLALAIAFLFPGVATAAENPVEVESLTGRAESLRTTPFRPLIEDEVEAEQKALSGGEGQYQLQILQQEVMELRGQVEELVNEIARMKATQDDRYLELDRRFQNLTREMADNTRAGGPSDTGGAVVSGPVASGSEDEKGLYDTALELIRKRQYDVAITQLKAVIDRYPDGIYTPNAYYWMGDVYASKPDPDLEAARQALAQVISFFPDHPKVPDALFKLGKVYHLLGDCDRARELLSQVASQHAGKSVGKLAEAYLRDKVSC